MRDILVSHLEIKAMIVMMMMRRRRIKKEEVSIMMMAMMMIKKEGMSTPINILQSSLGI